MNPALTAEEWATILPQPTLWSDYGHSLRLSAPLTGKQQKDIDVDHRPHAIVAAMLYDQPFGFTHEDANLLGWLAIALEDRGWRKWKRVGLGAHEGSPDDLREIAAKIAALLPP